MGTYVRMYLYSVFVGGFQNTLCLLQRLDAELLGLCRKLCAGGHLAQCSCNLLQSFLAVEILRNSITKMLALQVLHHSLVLGLFLGPASTPRNPTCPRLP